MTDILRDVFLTALFMITLLSIFIALTGNFAFLSDIRAVFDSGNNAKSQIIDAEREVLTSGSINPEKVYLWETRFNNITAEAEPRLKNKTVDDTIMLAIISDRLEWEKKFRIGSGRIMNSPESDTTIWVKVSSKAADEMYRELFENLSSANTSTVDRKKFMEKIQSYIVTEDIKAYPYSRFIKFLEKVTESK